MNLGSVADVSQVHTASIFRVDEFPYICVVAPWMNYNFDLLLSLSDTCFNTATFLNDLLAIIIIIIIIIIIVLYSADKREQNIMRRVKPRNS
jgi:pilus assembly protein TadC